PTSFVTKPASLFSASNFKRLFDFKHALAFKTITIMAPLLSRFKKSSIYQFCQASQKEQLERHVQTLFRDALGGTITSQLTRKPPYVGLARVVAAGYQLLRRPWFMVWSAR